MSKCLLMSSSTDVDMDEILDQNPLSNDASNDILRSYDATYAAYVQFVNSTERFLDVIWIDYSGQWIRYETLSPGEIYEVYTYVSHPWIFLDAESGARMVAAGRGKVFYPLMSDISHDIDEDGVAHLVPARVLVTVPVFSLKERCIEELCRYIDDKEAFEELPIPKELVQEIIQAYDIPSSYAVVDSALIESTTDEDEPTIAEEEEFEEDEVEAADADGEGDFTEDGDDEQEEEEDEWGAEPEAYFINDEVASGLYEDAINPYRDLMLPSVSSTPGQIPSSTTSSSASVIGQLSPPPLVLPRFPKRVKAPPEQTSSDDAVVADDERNDEDDGDEDDDDDDSFHSAQESFK